MKPSARRKRHLIRVWRTERSRIRTEPVYRSDGSVHYCMTEHPDFVRRDGWFTPGSYRVDRNGKKHNFLKTKAGQRYLKEVRLAARWDAYHATSDCCGWGKGEVYHDPYVYTGTDLVPSRSRPYPEPSEQCY